MGTELERFMNRTSNDQNLKASTQASDFVEEIKSRYKLLLD
jgi:hypothetical protein